MYRQSQTKAVPYGFICGYPVGGVSSELYGYYEGQGAMSGSQGRAVVEAMQKWGAEEAGKGGGTELGFPVCKRGYKPFDQDGTRLYGCLRHSHLRKEAMDQGGGGADTPYIRPGWESFAQWTFGQRCSSSSSDDNDDKGEDSRGGSSSEEDASQDAAAAEDEGGAAADSAAAGA